MPAATAKPAMPQTSELGRREAVGHVAEGVPDADGRADGAAARRPHAADEGGGDHEHQVPDGGRKLPGLVGHRQHGVRARAPSAPSRMPASRRRAQSVDAITREPTPSGGTARRIPPPRGRIPPQPGVDEPPVLTTGVDQAPATGAGSVSGGASCPPGRGWGPG